MRFLLQSSATIENNILYYAKENDWALLAIASEVQKQHLKQTNRSKILLMVQNVSDKVLNFKDFSRANKEIKYCSRTLTEFKAFSRQLTTKIQDLSKIVRTMGSQRCTGKLL